MEIRIFISVFSNTSSVPACVSCQSNSLNNSPAISQNRTFVSDFDMMLERRKKAMSRSRKRRNRDINITASDDVVSDMIQKMKHCAEEDRRLNLSERAATKKLTYLTTVSTALKK